MCVVNNRIILYPSNWLYNAGVIGFMKVLSYNKEINNMLNYENSNTVTIDVNVLNEIINRQESPLEEIPFWHYYYVYEGVGSNLEILLKEESKSGKKVFFSLKDKKIVFDCNKVFEYLLDNKLNEHIIKFLYHYRNYCAKLFSKNMIYANFYPPGKISDFNYFINYFKFEKSQNNNSKEKCLFCNSNYFKLEKLDAKLMNLLMPSYTGFPNSFWNNQNDNISKICNLCTFLLIHHHLALTKLSDGSEIFINAPSFQLMYELNKLVKEIFGKGELDVIQKREILAMSIIEYTRRLQTTLGLWNAMNIEIVIKSFENIEFYSLPYKVVNIILDKRVASLLSDIGEFSVLNNVLAENYQGLLDFSGHLIKIAIKHDRNKADNDFINDYLKREYNKKNINLTAQKILKLYATIMDRREKYARTN